MVNLPAVIAERMLMTGSPWQARARRASGCRRSMRRGVGTLCALGLALAQAALAESIVAATWGGAYGRAVAEAFYKPFTARTGIDVLVEDFPGGFARIQAQVDSGVISWDIVDLDLYDAVRGCDEGLLEPLDPSWLPVAPDGAPAAADFDANAITECGVALMFDSTIYAYNTEFVSGPAPQTIEDLFDLERFPGRRGMRRSPVANLEFALMADGVPPDRVYATLDTPGGVDRAFRKLSTIREHTVWWDAGAQAPRLLADGEVVMTTAYNGRIFNAQVAERQPFVIVWDGQVLAYSGVQAIVAGTPRFEAAREFVRFAAQPTVMSNIARHIPYSPTRSSAQSLLGDRSATGIDMRPHLPTTPAHLHRALKEDWRWWSENLDEMSERFNLWLTTR